MIMTPPDCTLIYLTLKIGGMGEGVLGKCVIEYLQGYQECDVHSESDHTLGLIFLVGPRDLYDKPDGVDSIVPPCTTGCVTISVKSDTPLFSDICGRSRLSFYVLNGQCGGFDFLKKKN